MSVAMSILEEFMYGDILGSDCGGEIEIIDEAALKYAFSLNDGTLDNTRMSGSDIARMLNNPITKAVRRHRDKIRRRYQ